MKIYIIKSKFSVFQVEQKMADVNGCPALDGIPDDFDMTGGRSRVDTSTSTFHSCTTDNIMNAPPSRNYIPDMFFPRLDNFSTRCGSMSAAGHMTDLTNSLPRHVISSTSASLSAQAILDKLECSDELSASLGEASCHANQQQGLEAELFAAVYDEPTEALSVTKSLEPTDVYGRVSCYDGKVVLQLRLLSLNTNFPINVSECWLCRNRIQGGSRMHAHKHNFQGVFQVNDEYIHLIMPESEPEIDKSLLHESFDGSHSADMLPNVTSGGGTGFRVENMDSDSFSLPYMAHSLAMDAEFLGLKENATNETYRGNSVNSEGVTRGTKSTVVDHFYNMCSGSINTDDPYSNFGHDPMRTENPFFLSLENRSMKNIPPSKEVANLTFSHPTVVSTNTQPMKDAVAAHTSERRAETGAKKRKSKAQKKPSVIRMKGDNTSFNSSNFLRNNCNTKEPMMSNIAANCRSLGDLSDGTVKTALREVSERALAADSIYNMKCSDTTRLQRSQRQLDANFNLVKQIIGKTEDVTCSVCKATFGRNLSDYEKHMINEHGVSQKSLYGCPICLKNFALNKHLVQHVRIHLGLKAFKCDQCGTTYGREETLKRHLLTHTSKRPHECRICPKSFARAEYLVAHMLAHNRTRHECTNCGVVCSSRFNLLIHARKHNTDKPFICELCNKSFVRSDFLDNHMEVVHKRNKPKCNVCGKLFSRKDVLKRHMSTHKAALYDCKFCLRSFTRKDRLVAHKRTHELNSELKCTKCPAAFHRREVLLKHRRLHETKEQCHICFKFAPTKGKLVVHLNWHKKDSANKGDVKNCHVCETCGKRLTRRELLLKHIRRVHGRPAREKGESSDAPPLAKRDKQFVCDICSKGFTRSCNLRAHVLKVHTKSRAEEDEDDPDDLDSLNSALSKSRPSQSTLVDLSSWNKVNKHHSKSEQHEHQPPTTNSGHSLLAVSNNPSVLDSYKENCSAWYPRSDSASPSTHLSSSLSLPQLSSQHPHSPINLSAEAITAAAYLLAYPSYLGPYQ